MHSWGMWIAVYLLLIAGCCGGESKAPTRERPTPPPGWSPPIARPSTDAEDGTPSGDDDSAASSTALTDDEPAAAPGDDDSAAEVPGPPNEQVLTDLPGQMLCYEGPELDGMYWPLQEGEIVEFVEVGRSVEPLTGLIRIDADVVIKGQYETLTGQLRAVYGLEGGAWVMASSPRWNGQEFAVKVRTTVPREVLDQRRLRNMSCDIVDKEGMCWEYDKRKLLEMDEEEIARPCTVWKGTMTETACPSAGKKAVCPIDDDHRIFYYDYFTTASPFLSYKEHCELAGGQVSAAD